MTFIQLARADALATARKQLATEHAAVTRCLALGLTGTDLSFARAEVVRLTSLIARLVAATKLADVDGDFCDACQQHRPCSCDDMASDEGGGR